MLHLHARVHLEEVEVVVLVDEELAGAGADVAHGLGRGDRRLAHALAQLGRDPVAGRLLDDLLVATLDRALALEEVDGVPVGVGQHLDLDVARLLHELLDVERVVAEGSLGLAPGAGQGLLELLLLAHQPHALAAAASARLDHHWQADLLREGRGLLVGERPGGAWHDGHAGLLHGLASGHLVAHRAHHVSARPDELDAFLLAEVGEVAVLREEAVAGVDAVGPCLLRDLEDLLHHEIRLAGRRRPTGIGLVCELHVKGVAIHVGIDGHRLDAHLAAGPDHADGDLAAVGDQDLLEHLGSGS